MNSALDVTSLLLVIITMLMAAWGVGVCQEAAWSSGVHVATARDAAEYNLSPAVTSRYTNNFFIAPRGTYTTTASGFNVSHLGVVIPKFTLPYEDIDIIVEHRRVLESTR